MPVKGLTPTLMEVGKIKIGKKGEWKESTGGAKFQQPEKLDHFLLTTLEKDSDNQFIIDEALTAQLRKDKTLSKNKDGFLTELPVRLLYDDIDLNFPTRYAAYYKGKCVCQGDGEKAVERDGKEKKCPCIQLEPNYEGRDKCKINGTLSVIIEGTQKLGGCHKFRTTSVNTCRNILGSLIFLKTASGGALAFLPLKLVIQPKTVAIPKDGSMTTVYVVSLIFAGTNEDFLQKSLETARYKAEHRLRIEHVEQEARDILELGSDSETDRDIAEEFYPDSVEVTVEEQDQKEEEEEKETGADGEDQSPTESADTEDKDTVKPADEQSTEGVEDTPEESTDESATEEPASEEVPPFVKPGTKGVEFADKSDFTRLKELKTQAGLDTKTWFELIEPYNVPTAKQMTKEQVAHFIRKLESLLPTEAQDE
jgi:hypothetical protein